MPRARAEILTSPEEHILSTGRRTFLKAGLAIGAVALFDGWQDIEENQIAEVNNNTNDTESNPDLQIVNPISAPIQKFDTHLKDPEEKTYGGTMIDSVAFNAGLHLWGYMTNNSIVKMNTTGISTEARNRKPIPDPNATTTHKVAVKAVATALIVGGFPVAEELVFRALPAVGGGKKSMLPIRGIISTYLFGKIHQVKSPPVSKNPFDKQPKPGFELNKNHVPVEQYAMGAFFWMEARRRGVAHSMVAHATNNATGLASGVLRRHINKDTKQN